MGLSALAGTTVKFFMSSRILAVVPDFVHPSESFRTPYSYCLDSLCFVTLSLLCLQFSKKYGPVFTVYMGGKKVVVLAGYKTLKEALVNRADVFGLRERMLIMQEFSKGHGKHGGLYVSTAALSRHVQVNSGVTIIHRKHLRCHLGAAGAGLFTLFCCRVCLRLCCSRSPPPNKQTNKQTLLFGSFFLILQNSFTC